MIRSPRVRRFWPAGLIGLAILGLLLWASARWVDRTAWSEARTAATARAAGNAGLLTSELQKYRLLPLVLADYPDVENALESPSPAATAQLNRTLEMLANRTDAAVIYVIARDGRTIAASNWRLPTSFVNQNYGFRRYFTDALQNQAAEQFALGTVSKRPGLFLARRIDSDAGVIVVKVEFDRLEAAWRRQSGPTIVRDANGVIVMSSKPSWQLRATHALPAALADRALHARLYGDVRPAPLDTELVIEGTRAVTTSRDSLTYSVASANVPVPGWTLSAIEPLAPAIASASAKARVALLALTLALVVSAGLVFRAREKRALAARAQHELEDQVRHRTAELRTANEQLRVESAERTRNEARLRRAHDDLAQAQRLGTLGQITAGVAHEINQPVAAIRSFADNAAVMLDRDDAAGTRGNLGQIVSLTQRIGDITSELRRFARRDHATGPVALSAAIDGSLLLMHERLQSAGVAVTRKGDAALAVEVIADHGRLEQIIINLLQNAADALADTANPAIALETSRRKDVVTLRCSDNGPGISTTLRDRLFTPFVTEKPSGLGLGLVIARDLARQFGGELSYEPSAKTSGATFVLKLKAA